MNLEMISDRVAALSDLDRDKRDFDRLLLKLRREGRFFDDDDSLTGLLGGEKMPRAVREIVKEMSFILSDHPILAKTVPVDLRLFFDAYIIDWSGRTAGRGQQVKRKDKDQMSDTGGSSKGRSREPEGKPSREDSEKRYRTKRKTPEQRDKDTDGDKDADGDKDLKANDVHPLDRKVEAFHGVLGPEDNYHRQVMCSLSRVMATVEGVSEKAFSAMDVLMANADAMVRRENEKVARFEGMGCRPEFCAESLFWDENADETTVRVASRVSAASWNVVEDDNLVKSLRNVSQRGGEWISEKQARFFLSKVRQGGYDWKRSRFAELKNAHPGSSGVVMSELSEPNAKGFVNADAVVVDGRGIVARYLFWAKKVETTIKHDRMEDLYDDHGGRSREIDPEVKQKYERDRYDYRTTTSWKNGLKKMYERRD